MNKKVAIKVAAKYGGTIEVGDYNSYDQSTVIEALAPDGFEWAESGSQILTAYKYQYANNSGKEAYQDLITRMNYGIQKIDHPNNTVLSDFTSH